MTQPYNPPPAPTPPPSARPPWWKRLWVVAVGAGILGLIIGAAAAGGSSKSAADKPGPTVTATATAISTVSAPTPPASTVTLKPTVVKTVATRTHIRTVTYTPPPKPAVNDGTYQVGSDIKPGQYRTDGQSEEGSCYWERDSNLSGSINSTIANDNIDGPTIIEADRGEYLKLSGGCDWRHV